MGQVDRQVPGLGQRVDPARVVAAAEPVERPDAGQVQPDRPAREPGPGAGGSSGSSVRRIEPTWTGLPAPSVDQDQHRRLRVGPDRPGIGA